jgi:hypothetical protein
LNVFEAFTAEALAAMEGWPCQVKENDGAALQMMLLKWGIQRLSTLKPSGFDVLNSTVLGREEEVEASSL